MKQVFSIVPGSNGPFLILGGVSLLLVALIGLLLYIAGSSRNTKFEISERACVFGGTFTAEPSLLKL